MKKYVGIIRTSILLAGLACTTAFAKNKSHDVTFYENTIVNGTLVKKGNYRAVFDEQAGNFTLFDGKQVVATAKAKEENLSKKAEQTIMDLHKVATGMELGKITFGGDPFTIVLNDAGQSDGQ